MRNVVNNTSYKIWHHSLYVPFMELQFELFFHCGEAIKNAQWTHSKQSKTFLKGKTFNQIHFIKQLCTMYIMFSSGHVRNLTEYCIIIITLISFSFYITTDGYLLFKYSLKIKLLDDAWYDVYIYNILKNTFWKKRGTTADKARCPGSINTSCTKLCRTQWRN